MWALGLATAVSLTTNPLHLVMAMAVASLVVAARRPETTWAGGYRAYLIFALIVIGIRLVFRIVLGGDFGVTPLVSLPRLTLPDWAGGMALGGPITLEETLAGLYDGLRLAALVVCVGAANTLADPRRLLASFPRSLGGLATSAVVALSLAPQLVESVFRARRARRLRGDDGRGWRSLRSLLVPVLEDTMARSVALAASMDARGYGRMGATPRPGRAAGLPGLIGLCVGSYLLLSQGSGTWWWIALVVTGLVVAVMGISRRGTGPGPTRYRPDRWEMPEWLVAGAGIAAAAAMITAGWLSPSSVVGAVQPLTWPTLDPLAGAGLAIAALPAWAAPPVTVARRSMDPAQVST